MTTIDVPLPQPCELRNPLFNSTLVNYSDMTDVELVSACQQNSPDAFKWLVKRHQSTVFGVLHRLAPECQDSVDLVQEVFIRIWHGIGALSNPHAFRSWAKRIATNIFYDRLRQRSGQVMLSLDAPIECSDEDSIAVRQIADQSALPDELAELHQLSEAIRAAVEKLPRPARTMIKLRDFEERSYEEIAHLTNSPIGTVKSRIARARSKLQVMLLPRIKEIA